jgi:hypothetical protein
VVVLAVAWLVAALANQFLVGAVASQEAATSKWLVPAPAVDPVVEPGVAWLGP